MGCSVSACFREDSTRQLREPAVVSFRTQRLWLSSLQWQVIGPMYGRVSRLFRQNRRIMSEVLLAAGAWFHGICCQLIFCLLRLYCMSNVRYRIRLPGCLGRQRTHCHRFVFVVHRSHLLLLCARFYLKQLIFITIK